MRVPTLLAIAASLLAGCGATPPSDDRIGQTGHASSAIVGGQVSDATEDFVVLVARDGDTASFCAGTLLAPNLVVTALHCVAETDDASFSCDDDGNVVPGGGGHITTTPDPKVIRVVAGDDALGRFARGEGRGVGVARVLADGEAALCSHDIAFLVLDGAMGDKPIASLRLDQRATVEDRVSIAGWGQADDLMLHFERRTRRGIPILAVGPARTGEETSLGATVPRTFLTGPGGCYGDSGAPGFVGRAALGIMSRGMGFALPAGGGSQCAADTATVGFTMIVDFGDLLHKAFGASNARPLVDGKPVDWLSFGAACTLGAQCASNVCARKACNMDCSVGACPDGFACDGASQNCVRVATPESAALETRSAESPLGSSARSDCAFSAPGLPARRSCFPALGIAVIASLRRRRRALSGGLVFLGAAFLVACSLEDPARTPQGSSPTVQAAPLDASAPSEPPPRGSVAIDAGESANDASSTEDASEAGAADAEPPAASICTTYPNSSLSLVDGGPLFKRYFAIALQTMQRARGDCAIGNHFATYGSTSPIQIGCFANELMAEAGCTDAEGKELRYSDSFDPNNVSCAPADPGQDSVRVGFHNPKSNGVTNADLDRFLGIVEVVAVSSGQLAPEDAMRLKAALDAKRSAVVGSTAAGYSAAKDGCNVP